MIGGEGTADYWVAQQEAPERQKGHRNQEGQVDWIEAKINWKQSLSWARYLGIWICRYYAE